MAKSIKLNDNTYIDSSDIIINRRYNSYRHADTLNGLFFRYSNTPDDIIYDCIAKAYLGNVNNTYVGWVLLFCTNVDNADICQYFIGGDKIGARRYSTSTSTWSAWSFYN